MCWTHSRPCSTTWSPPSSTERPAGEPVPPPTRTRPVEIHPLASGRRAGNDTYVFGPVSSTPDTILGRSIFAPTTGAKHAGESTKDTCSWGAS